MSTTSRATLVRYLIEGVLIVASILLAFGIQAWWDERGDREIEHSLLVELQAEFEANRASLQSTADAYRRTREAAEALTAIGSSDSRPNADSLAALFGTASSPAHWEAASGALATAVNSGRITLIQNPQLRRRLVAWDGVTSDLYADEASRIDVVQRVVRPTLAKFGIGGGAAPDTDFASALASREVRAYLRSSATGVTHILGHYSAAKEEMDALIDALETELSRW